MGRGRLGLLVCAALFGAALGACDTPPGPVDAGLDGGSPSDAGTDAPYVPLDTGMPGAALMPVDACDDLVDDLYRTPAGLPAFEPSVRGALLGCASIRTIPAAEVAARLSGVPGLSLAGGDLREYVIAYRTEREPRGVGGISTALVYLPTVALSERVPLVVAAHGSIGTADHCAPSRLIREGVGPAMLPADYIDAFLLSFAARGLPVVAPDYAGLGTEGTHGYANWLDPARSVVDGVRALRALLPAERLDGGAMLYGHSQGGGVSLAAAAVQAEAPDVDVRAVIAAAPAYRFTNVAAATRLSTFALTPFTRGVLALGFHSEYANLTTDQGRWVEPFVPQARDLIAAELSNHCLVEAATNLDVPSAGYVPATTLGELLDPTFTAAVAACLDDGACDGLVGAWVARDAANEPHLSPTSPPILVVGSDADELATPATVGCVVGRLRTENAPFDTCMVPVGDHLEMVSGTAAYSIEWALATATGSAMPPCPGSVMRPACRLF